MILGTHNSLTAYPLKGLCKLLGWLSWTAKCQDKDIYEQYEDGVRYFNLQIGYYHDKWIGSHGLFWYDVDVWSVLKYLNTKKDCHVQLFLDNHFFTSQHEDEFVSFVKKARFVFKYIKFEAFIIERDWQTIRTNETEANEQYWSRSSCKSYKEWYRLLPYPKLWAKRHNAYFRLSNKSEYLMLDFFEI